MNLAQTLTLNPRHLDRQNSADVRAILAGGRDRGAWFGGDGLEPVPADFTPTTVELAMLLNVRFHTYVEVDPATEKLYERLQRVGALRVDVGPTLCYCPARSFESALLAG